MPTEVFDIDRLKPENVTNLSEAEQQRLLADIKAEVTRIEAKTKASQKEAIRKIRQQISRHEAQSAWFSGEFKRIDELLASRSPEEDTPDQAQARAMLESTRTFYRAGRKMLTIQLQDLREDFSKVSAETLTAFELADPYNTYEWRLASAEADLAALQVMMGELEYGQRALATALKVPTIAEPGESTGPLSYAIPTKGSRELTAVPARSSKLASSTLGLDDVQPSLEDPAGSAEPGSEDQGTSAPSAEELPPEVQAIVEKIRDHFTADPRLEERAKAIAAQLAETNGLIRQGRAQMARISSMPPKEGATLLQQGIWNRINGRVYALQRLGEQCGDDKVLAALFPKIEPPELPFMRAGEPQTRKLVDSTTDRLRLPD